MATITNDDFTWMVGWLRNHPTYKITLRESGLEKQQLFDTLQGVETWEENGHNSTPTEGRSAAMDTAAGQALNDIVLETAIWLSWSAWKAATS